MLACQKKLNHEDTGWKAVVSQGRKEREGKEEEDQDCHW